MVTGAKTLPCHLQTSLPLQALCVQGPMVGPTARGQDPATDVLFRQQQQSVLLQPAQEACSTQHQAPPHSVSVGCENSHNENGYCHHQHHRLTSHRTALYTKVVTSHCQHHPSSQEQVCRGVVPIHPVEIEGQKGQANDSGHPGSSKTIFICAQPWGQHGGSSQRLEQEASSSPSTCLSTQGGEEMWGKETRTFL